MSPARAPGPARPPLQPPVPLWRQIADHLRREREVFVAGLETDDIRSGFEAFFAGERPVFHGR